jgi:hypothetical protein
MKRNGVPPFALQASEGRQGSEFRGSKVEANSESRGRRDLKTAEPQNNEFLF